MKLTKKLEIEVLDVYEAFWGGLLNADMELYAAVLDVDYRLIGTTEEEVFFNKKEAIRFLKATAEQMAGNLGRKNSKIKIEAVGGLAFLTEQFDAYVLIDGDWTFYGNTRVSSWMQQQSAGWKLVQQHFSFPDGKADEGETIGLEKIAKENLELREAIKRRTIELENKSRELEIEASLERIRTVTMGMNTPADILNICRIFFTELQALGFKDVRNALINFWDDENGLLHDYDYSDFSGGNFTRLPYSSHPTFEEFQKKIRKAKDAFAKLVIEKKGLKSWEQRRRSSGEYKDPRLSKISALYYYFYSTGVGALGISAFSPLSKDEIEVLKKFRNVFDLAYKRYVDIQKSEAQAKEAQIEAGLERVRSRSMAMHNTSELQDVIHAVHKELLTAGIAINGGSFIAINSDIDKTLRCWGSGGTADTSTELHIPLYKKPFCTNLIKRIKKGAGFFTEEYTQKDKKEFFHFLFRHEPWSKLNAEQKKETISSPGGYTRSCFVSEHTSIFIVNHFGQVFSAADNDILKRFGKVFDQTYTRFLDLQKAEEQTRAAQIELAVERVRTKALAMNSSKQILDVVVTLRNEMLGLDIPGVVAATIYLQEEDGNIRMWDLSSVLEMQDGFQVALDVKFKLAATDPGLYIRRVWNNKKNYFVEKQEAADLAITLDWLRQYYPEQADEAQQFFNTTEWKYILHPTIQLAHGKMSVDILDAPSPAEMESILVKMGAAFDLAYKRFLDLQQSEKQIREAQIELALERVRARTMAMQHSDELADASFVLDTQVRSLGIKTHGCAFNIYGEDGSTEWFSSEMGTMPSYKTPMEDLFLRYYEAGIHGELIHIEKFEKENCIAHYEYLCTLPGLGDGLKALIRAGGSFPTRQTDHVVYFKYGYLLFITLEDVPEAHDIFIRFTKVFEQTYTRFLDLQKAEAQAEHAELALIAIKDAKQKAEEALAELQITQRQLIQSEKMASLGELTAGIAHEIQNPLNFVNNFSEVSKELLNEMKEAIEKGDTDEANEIMNDVIQNLEKINHHGKRADGIVKGMLQHSRNSGGTKEPTDINILADEYLRLAYHGIRAKDNSFNAILKTDFDKTIGNINIIPQDIGRVILNLITNAFYAVNEKRKQGLEGYEPTVAISTKSNSTPSGGRSVEIKVSDNGGGIPQRILDKIFQPFFTTKPTGQGTGLGLSLSYDIVKVHDGELKVETKENKGTTFIIQLPII